MYRIPDELKNTKPSHSKRVLSKEAPSKERIAAMTTEASIKIKVDKVRIRRKQVPMV